MNFAVEIYDISIPLKNGITLENLLEFNNLLTNQYGNSGFKKWFDNNLSQINNKIRTTITDDFINDFFSEDINILSFHDKIKNLFKLPSQSQYFLDRKIEQTTPKSILIGGLNNNISLNDLKCFFYGIVCYLFSPSLNEKNIHDPVNKNNNQHGGNEPIDWTGQRMRDRLIFCVEINSQKYSIKVSNGTNKGYLSEAEIYKEFAQFYKNKEEQKNVVQFVNHEFFNISNYGQYNFKIKDSIYSNKNMDTKIQSFVDSNKNIEKMQYLVLEVESGYKTFAVFLNNLFELKRENPHKLKIKKTGADECSIIEKVLKLLFRFNIDLGFNHWDFHNENLLISENGDIKFFDFDQSSTRKNKNFILYNALNNFLNINLDKNGNDITLVGLIYDILRFLYNFRRKYVNVDCDPIEKNYNDIIKVYQDIKDIVISVENGTVNELRDLLNKFVQLTQKIYYDENKKNLFLKIIESGPQYGGKYKKSNYIDYKYKYHKYKAKYISEQNK
jgi:hypothetical protein